MLVLAGREWYLRSSSRQASECVYIGVMDPELLKKAARMSKEGFEIANRVRREELKGRTHEKWLHGLHGLFMVCKPGTSLFDDAARLQKALTEEGLSFCFIGGVAQQHWGEPRQTSDLDLDIHCEIGNESAVLAALLRHLSFRDDESKPFWDSHRVFFGCSPNGYDVDVFVGFTPFERRIAARAVSQDYGLGPVHTTPDAGVMCCCPRRACRGYLVLII